MQIFDGRFDSSDGVVTCGVCDRVDGKAVPATCAGCGGCDAHCDCVVYNTPLHDCMEHPVPYVGDGPLGHGVKCGVCDSLLQVG